MMKIIDNINHLLGDDLQEHLSTTSDSQIKIAASYFSIYAFHKLKKELEKIDKLEFIFTSPTFIADNVVDQLKKQKREYVINEPFGYKNEHLQSQFWRENSLYGSKFELHLKNKLTQKAK